MALGKQLGEYSLKATTFTYLPGPAGSTLVQANFEGQATGFVSVLGTGTFVPAGAKSGTWSWCGTSYMDNGDSTTATGQGSHDSVGSHKWRTQGVIHSSDGRSVTTEGEIDLAARVWSGKIYE